MRFPELVAQISRIDSTARLVAGQRLQQVLSLRNWLIGAYIVEFEQAGEDRAAYGQHLMETLAEVLRKAGCQGLSARNLMNFRQVTLTYPKLNPENLSRRIGFPDAYARISQAPAKSSLRSFPKLEGRASDAEFPWRDTGWMSRLFTTLTFTHLIELSRIEDTARRAFYELYCLKERWSYRELQRQRDSMLYERIGLSESREEVLALAREGALAGSPAGELRDPYVFEFLGIEQRAVVSENDLERALVDHLQHFLFELGRDFCFIARQFRITASNRHYYIDLLLFHRRLRCLVAIDLKLGSFEPSHAGQLRFYVNYLAEHVAYPDENPPVGILLCAEQDAEVVRFATAGDEDIFVTRYQLELPTEEQLKSWLHEERARLELTKSGSANEP